MLPDYCYNAIINRVVDGDTVDAQIDLGFNIFIRERLRIANIDAPETYGVKKDSAEYEAGMVAKNRLVELVDGKQVTIKTEKKGKYGRYIAEIFVDGSSVGEVLLSEGIVERYL